LLLAKAKEAKMAKIERRKIIASVMSVNLLSFYATFKIFIYTTRLRLERPLRNLTVSPFLGHTSATVCDYFVRIAGEHTHAL
jgi:hypothetical protein